VPQDTVDLSSRQLGDHQALLENAIAAVVHHTQDKDAQHREQPKETKAYRYDEPRPQIHLAQERYRNPQEAVHYRPSPTHILTRL
jgi:hypothetical protein